MNKRKLVLDALDEAGVCYTLVQHPAARNMEDIARYGIEQYGPVCKNLFLRDSKKGRQHFLVTVLGSTRVDLDVLGKALGQRLSFASPERLQRYLNIEAGQVTPLAVLFDEGGEVTVCFDTRLNDTDTVGVHPCDNTATVFLQYEDLKKMVELFGNAYREVAL